jgi:hypothetical protein
LRTTGTLEHFKEKMKRQSLSDVWRSVNKSGGRQGLFFGLPFLPTRLP